MTTATNDLTLVEKLRLIEARTEALMSEPLGPKAISTIAGLAATEIERLQEPAPPHYTSGVPGDELAS